MRIRWIAFLALFFLSFACEKVVEHKAAPVENKGGVLPIREAPSQKGEAPLELTLQKIRLEEFLGHFKYDSRPSKFEITRDFEKVIDPTLYHFERVEVELPKGGSTEIRMQNFGAYGIWKNAEGNFEMITTIINGKGTIMHFHTLDADLKNINSFELARNITNDATQTIKKGYFNNADTYHYTYHTIVAGQMGDSIQGGMIVPASGNYMTLGGR